MKKGFSLTEILVSIAIIGILSGIGIQAFVASRQRARLEEDVAKVVQALRKAQNSALAPSRSETGVQDNQTLCSIILKIENKQLNLYYSSKNSNSNSNSNCTNSNSPYLNLGKINYASIEVYSSSDIVFDIPFATTLGGKVELSIDNSGNSISKTIEVTNSGLIKVE